MAEYNVTGSWQRYQPMAIRALQQGGYERVGIPNPNSAMALYKGGYGISTPNTQQLERQADLTDAAELERVRQQEAEERAQFMYDPLNPRGIGGSFREAREAGGQLQREINPEFNKWRLYGQALKNQGVDVVQTAGAAGAKQGGGVDRRQVVDYTPGKNQVAGYDYSANLGTSSPGFFDVAPHISIAEMYQKSPGMTMDPTAYQKNELQPHNLYENNALRQLRNWRMR